MEVLSSLIHLPVPLPPIGTGKPREASDLNLKAPPKVNFCKESHPSNMRRILVVWLVSKLVRFKLFRLESPSNIKDIL